ncbi:MAG: glycosyltransferase involved in cell wall biosynthesis [Gammaproteobacteria bacterium]|jgi:glycosyltransferase involved in cell wall biosynthesis
MNDQISIILPAKNEASALEIILPKIRVLFPATEIIVVNDGSIDDTINICAKNSVEVVSHPYSIGNGAAIKSGVRAATGEILVFMDADGQHNPQDISSILKRMEEGFDMVVGARSASSQASIGRLCANTFYNWFASMMVGQKVNDLTSGFRAVRADKFMKFLYLLPNGFSYPTTCTMAFFRSGYTVGYVPIEAEQRMGKSHIKLFKDGIRFLLILFKIGTLYSPLKIFLPLSFISFVTGFGYYLYTFLTVGRFTNMSALLFTTSVTIFLMGLISEQITSLLYSKARSD